MDYSSQEYCDMLILYGECGRSARATAEEYAVRFPNRRLPDKSVILRLVHRARETGKLAPDRRDGNVVGRPRSARVPATEEMVMQLIEDDPTLSLRNIARVCDTSYSTAQRILSESTMHAYDYTRVHSLQPGDYAQRLEFCRWLLRRNEENPNFTREILFTDESTFGRDGTFNYHNLHVWAFENPHATRVRGFQVRFTINLWAGIKGDVLVGPFELPDRLNGENYAEFLEVDFPELLGNAELERGHMWFQHDGAPAHFAVRARAVLDRDFPDAWIGRGGPVAWPPRSPDLNMLDFFLWGHVKEKVYRHEINTIQELRDAITEAIATVTPAMLRRAQESLVRRAHLCIEAQGGHFEHLL